MVRSVAAGCAAMSMASLRSAPPKLVAVPPAMRAPYWASDSPSRTSSTVVAIDPASCRLS